LEYICQYCGKICKNLNGLKHHELFCKSNPNHKNHPGNKGYDGNGKGMPKNYVAWNKNQTKETNIIIYNTSLKIKEKYKNGDIKRKFEHHTEETKHKLSILRQKAIAENPDLIKSCGRAKKYNYNDIVLDGTWEVIFAKYLDELNIKWIRPKKGYEYIFEGSKHLYFPDFFLPQYNLYIEVKGYEREIDHSKWIAIIKLGYNIKIIKQSDIQSIKNGNFDIFKKPYWNPGV